MLRFSFFLGLLLLAACNSNEAPNTLDLASPLEGIYEGELELYAPNVSYEIHLQQRLEIRRLSNDRISVEPIDGSLVEPFTAQLRRNATGVQLLIDDFMTDNGIRVQGGDVDSTQVGIHGYYVNEQEIFAYALQFNDGAQLENFSGQRLD